MKTKEADRIARAKTNLAIQGHLLSTELVLIHSWASGSACVPVTYEADEASRKDPSMAEFHLEWLFCLIRYPTSDEPFYHRQEKWACHLFKNSHHCQEFAFQADSLIWARLKEAGQNFAKAEACHLKRRARQHWFWSKLISPPDAEWVATKASTRMGLYGGQSLEPKMS